MSQEQQPEETEKTARKKLNLDPIEASQPVGDCNPGGPKVGMSIGESSSTGPSI